MSLIDEKGRILGRVNIIDLLLVLLVAALVLGSLYKLDLFNRFQPQEQPVAVSVIIDDVRSYTADALQEGDPVWESVENAFIGRIVKKEVRPARKVVPRADGSLVESESPTRYDVILTIEGSLVVKGSDIYVGKKDIKIGSKVYIKTPRAAAESYAIDLAVKSRPQ